MNTTINIMSGGHIVFLENPSKAFNIPTITVLYQCICFGEKQTKIKFILTKSSHDLLLYTNIA